MLFFLLFIRLFIFTAACPQVQQATCTPAVQVTQSVSAGAQSGLLVCVHFFISKTEKQKLERGSGASKREEQRSLEHEIWGPPGRSAPKDAARARLPAGRTT